MIGYETTLFKEDSLQIGVITFISETKVGIKDQITGNTKYIKLEKFNVKSIENFYDETVVININSKGEVSIQRIDQVALQIEIYAVTFRDTILTVSGEEYTVNTKLINIKDLFLRLYSEDRSYKKRIGYLYENRLVSYE